MTTQPTPAKRTAGDRPYQPPMTLTVTRTEQLTRVLRRVWFHSDELARFNGSDFTDRYVKLMFLQEGVTYPTLDTKVLRATLRPDELPVVRTYTALFPDVALGTLAIDFVLHGDLGVAGPWASRAQPGDQLHANGPGGAYRPTGDADWHLLAGDESAVPAITAALEALPGGSRAEVVLLLDRPGDEPELSLGPAVTRTHAYRHESTDGPHTLTEAIRDLPLPQGEAQAFVHGEADDVMHGVRPFLFQELGWRREQVSISGYWRRGRTEEGFRQWKSELSQSEREPARL